MKKIVVVFLVVAMLLQPVFSSAEPNSAREALELTQEAATPEPTQEAVTPEPTQEVVTPEPTQAVVTPEPTQEDADNENYLEMAQAIPLADGSDILPDEIEAQLMSTGYIGEDDIILTVKKLVVSLMADMELSSQEKEQICLKFSEESGILIGAENITLPDNYVELNCIIGSIKYCYKVFTDGYIIKEVSMCFENVEYSVRNGNNELLVKIDGSKAGERVEKLSEEELDEFIYDMKQGLVPLMDIYTIEYVRAYFASKSAETAQRGLEAVQSTSSTPNLFITPLSDAGYEPCVAKYITSEYGYCNGLHKYSPNNSNFISVDIYDTRRYVLVEETSKEFEALKTVGDIANFLKAPDTLVEAALLAAGILVGVNKAINGPVMAFYAAKYNGFYTREGAFYENTFVRGKVEAYEVYGECLLTYAGINPDSQGVYTDFVWAGSEVSYVGHETIDYYPQSYANLVAEKYYAELEEFGYWQFGSNRDGGLLDGTQFPEHAHAFPTTWTNKDAQNHIRYCANGICSEEEPHVYSGKCDITCDICQGVNLSRGHTFGNWANNGDSGEVAYCSKCGMSQTRAHQFTITPCDGGPTCTLSATDYYICENCGYNFFKTIPSLGHDMRSGVCTYKYCARDGCGYTTGTSNHVMGNWITTIAPTCTDSGVRKRACNNCSFFVLETIPAVGHSYGSLVTTAPATCITSGTQRQSCDNCSAYILWTIPALGHSYGSWVTTTSPTCNNSGTKKRSCSNCSSSITETIPALGHSYGSWSDYSVNQHRRKCTRCTSYQYGSHYGTGQNCAACGRPRPWSTTQRIVQVY